MKLNLILSKTNHNIIGYKNQLLIKIKEDLQYFSKITTYSPNEKENIIVMGYNTYQSINKKLKNRINIIISNDHYNELENDNIVYRSFEGFFNDINKFNYNNIFIIGGSQIYNTIFYNYNKYIDKIYITQFDYDKKHSNCVFFNHSLKDYNIIYNIPNNSLGEVFDEEINSYDTYKLNYNFICYQRGDINLNDKVYNDLCIDILKKDNIREGRNGGIISEFGTRMEFDLLKGFPLLTTKKVSWRNVLKELLWFISGSTDNNILKGDNVNIWNLNAEEYHQRSMKREGDLGPIYGFQWRHFGAEYTHSDDNYNNKGIDQLKYIIDEIKKNPQSRRLLFSAWNPVNLKDMALPPCHVSFQFYIEDNYIDGQLYQRSGDLFLGVPYNIASYSFLLHIIGNITGYIPRKLIHIIGDTHIYLNHIESIKEQIIRVPNNYPKLEIKNKIEDIDNIDISNFNIINYNPHPPIKNKMIL